MKRQIALWRRWLLFYRVHRTQRCCQFAHRVAAVYGDAGLLWLATHTSTCAGVNLVLPRRPFGRPTPADCTLLCNTHWRWALTHLQPSVNLGLLARDWHIDLFTESEP